MDLYLCLYLYPYLCVCVKEKEQVRQICQTDEILFYLEIEGRGFKIVSVHSCPRESR